jgi:hypothetical protein
MLIKPQKGYFMCIRINHQGRKIFIPIPLFVLKITLESAIDIAGLILKISTLTNTKKANNKSFTFKSIIEILDCTYSLINEFSRYGRIKIVEIEVEQIQLSIAIY